MFWILLKTFRSAPLRHVLCKMTLWLGYIPVTTRIMGISSGKKEDTTKTSTDDANGVLKPQKGESSEWIRRSTTKKWTDSALASYHPTKLQELTDISVVYQWCASQHVMFKDVFNSSPVCTDHVVVSLHSSLANVLMKIRNNYQWDIKCLRTATLPSATLNTIPSSTSSKCTNRTVFLVNKLTCNTW